MKPDIDGGILDEGLWMDFCPYRIKQNWQYRAYYALPWPFLGVVAKVARDGTPWLFKGQRYNIRISDGWVRLAIGKYALGFSWLEGKGTNFADGSARII